MAKSTSEYDELNTISKDFVDKETNNNDDELMGYLSDELPDTPSDQGWVQRYFGPIKKGSLRGSTIAMAAMTFGVGCLQFPLAIVNIGLIPGLAIMFICVALSWWSLYILTLSGRKKRIMSYDTLVGAVLGKWVLLICAINNVLLLFGVLIAYEKTVSGLSMTILSQFWGINPDDEKIKLIQVGICMVPQILVGLLKDMSKLQFVGMISGLTLVYTSLVIIFEAPFYAVQEHQRSINLVEPPSLKLFASFSAFLFTFATHNGIFGVYKELKRPSERRTMKVLNRSLGIEIVMYTLIGLAGFFSLLRDTPDVFIMRKPLLSLGGIDYFMSVSLVLLVLCLTCSLAIIYNILRGAITALAFNGKPIPFFIDLIITILTFVATNVITYFVHAVVDVIGILGGFCAVNICYVFPILVYVYSNDYPKTHWKNIGSWIILVLVVAAGYTAAILVVIHFINPKAGDH